MVVVGVPCSSVGEYPCTDWHGTQLAGVEDNFPPRKTIWEGTKSCLECCIDENLAMSDFDQ